ncbi:uncharacterized protein SAPINGB_P000905 [Magnusiomyces paraingens]|uniref:Signal peptidase complex subunit 2 n=1 Tax=Magnusiomyces paraingens TaxID=2606893 RepID=A0A5E8B2X3_9ASCO|nr:uncharacterized protein SAPINGB_P000905 [Saprochaete ingens]VVT45816.1 unnamed protein product [Saprochaete ingens]
MTSVYGTQKDPINLYNTSLLKSTSDDQVPLALKELGYSTNNYLVDVRLALGYASVIVAALTAFYDHKVGFFAAKYPWTVLGLFFYAAFNIAYTYWIWFVEAGVIYSGTKGPLKVSIATNKGSKKSKYDPVYDIKVTVSSEKTKAVSEKTGTFDGWFATNGMIDYKKFAAWISSAVSEAEAKVSETASKKKN